MRNKKIVANLLCFFCLSANQMLQGQNNSSNSLLEQLPHHIKLSWETSPANSQSVSWRTRGNVSENYLEYRESTASPFFEDQVVRIKAQSDSLTSDDGTWYYHSVNITGLRPNTRYLYRVGKGDAWSAWAEFTTATGGKEPFTFLYFGDVQRDIFSKGSRTIRATALDNPDARFMLFAGDMVHRGGLNKENWNEFFPTGGWLFQYIPMLATPGNHEHLIAKSGENLSPLWQLSFCFPQNSPRGHEEETYYVDYNNLRIISLNMCRYKYPKDRKEIYQWTEKRLKEFDGDWLIVMQHYNMVSSARNRSADIRFPEFKKLFEKYNVPLVLTGHEHLYARGRFGSEFPVYTVSVSGPYQNAIRFDNWLERAGTSMQLYQVIRITPDTLSYTAKTVLGDVYDAFTITKTPSGKLIFTEKENLMKESLEPPLNFAERYDADLVKSYEADKQKYLQRNMNKK